MRTVLSLVTTLGILLVALPQSAVAGTTQVTAPVPIFGASCMCSCSVTNLSSKRSGGELVISMFDNDPGEVFTSQDADFEAGETVVFSDNSCNVDNVCRCKFETKRKIKMRSTACAGELKSDKHCDGCGLTCVEGAR